MGHDPVVAGKTARAESESPPPLTAVVVDEPIEASPRRQSGGRSSVVADPPSELAAAKEPVRWRELLAILLAIALADLTIYRGHGFAGYAALFAASTFLLLLGTPRLRSHAAAGLVVVMLLVLAAKLAWCGHAGLVAAGFVLIVAVAMTLAGRKPYVLDIAVYALQTPVAGWIGLSHYMRSADSLQRRGPPRGGWLSVGLPLVAVLAFGALFVLANPDLAASFRETLRWAFDSFADWLRRFSPTWGELFFWVAVAWLVIGLLRPVVRDSVLAGLSTRDDRGDWATAPPAESPLYAAVRNTLAAVIVLFAVYLGFEFKTLWFKTFPKGFYYAGYAHEGAAWLTVALALATAVLSLVFRGRILHDPRLSRLRKLAWIWSAENLVLALAVYHRLFIYIGFNGMTRMRTVGLFGISAVAVGFILVVWKIIHSRNFAWLLHRHLWTLAVALYLLAVTPVDPIVHAYNVRRVLADDPAPVVQVSVHPISSEGMLVLPPLAHSRDRIIREGIRAMLADRAAQLGSLVRRRQSEGWTAFQLADRVLLERLQAVRNDWQEYTDPDKRAAALNRFHAYAYQWY
ncbi:MAG: DUF4173 domain-containing protein [Pirellulales bacterium]|nr:DUF4173 domain-containing protein [Pirellulales bacterium]